MTDKEPSLGSLLSQTLNELEQAKIEGLEAQANADLEKIRKERADLTQFVNKIADDITEAVTAGKVPKIKVSAYDRYTWVNKVNDPRWASVAHRDIWDGLQFWALRHDLNITVTEDWDGGGTKSWINISALPRKGPSRADLTTTDFSKKTNQYGKLLFGKRGYP
jgi:hypothetical protein